MTRHWIVVGDGGGAKIFASDELIEKLVLVEKFEHDHGRITHGDAPPSHASPAAAAAHEQRPDAQREAEDRFARAVAHAVTNGDNRHQFERLILVAPPKFLGSLRSALSRPLLKKLVATIHHDWTKVPVPELSAHIRKNLPEAAGM